MLLRKIIRCKYWTIKKVFAFLFLTSFLTIIITLLCEQEVFIKTKTKITLSQEDISPPVKLIQPQEKHESLLEQLKKASINSPISNAHVWAENLDAADLFKQEKYVVLSISVPNHANNMDYWLNEGMDNEVKKESDTAWGYVFNLAITARTWKRINYSPIVLVALDSPNMDEYAKELFLIVQNELKSLNVPIIYFSLPSILKTRLSSFLRLMPSGLDIFPDESYVVTSDVDIWPSTSAPYRLQPPATIHVTNALCCSKFEFEHKKYETYPMSTIGMKAQVWNDVLNIRNLFSFNSNSYLNFNYDEFENSLTKFTKVRDFSATNKDEDEKLFELDEMYISVKLQDYLADGHQNDITFHNKFKCPMLNSTQLEKFDGTRCWDYAQVFEGTPWDLGKWEKVKKLLKYLFESKELGEVTTFSKLFSRTHKKLQNKYNSQNALKRPNKPPIKVIKKKEINSNKQPPPKVVMATHKEPAPKENIQKSQKVPPKQMTQKELDENREKIIKASKNSPKTYSYVWAENLTPILFKQKKYAVLSASVPNHGNNTNFILNGGSKNEYRKQSSTVWGYVFNIAVTSRVWRRINYTPVVMLALDYPNMDDDAKKLLSIITNELKNNNVPIFYFSLPSIMKTRYSQFLRMMPAALNLFPDNSYILTSDADIWPARFAPYDLRPPATIHVTNSLCCAKIMFKNKEYQTYPMTTIGMKANIWNEAVPFANYFSYDRQSYLQFDYELFYKDLKIYAPHNDIYRDTLHGDKVWGLDQTYISVQIHDYVDDGHQKDISFANKFTCGMITFENLPKYDGKKCWDYAHVFKGIPFKDWEWGHVQVLLKQLFDSKKIEDINKFRLMFFTTFEEIKLMQRNNDKKKNR